MHTYTFLYATMKILQAKIACVPPACERNKEVQRSQSEKKIKGAHVNNSKVTMLVAGFRKVCRRRQSKSNQPQMAVASQAGMQRERTGE